jgi:YD repeat-containing protein
MFFLRNVLNKFNILLKIMGEPIIKYNSKGKLIYFKNSNGIEAWYEYDENGNMIHFKNSYGYEYWCGYDEHNNIFFYLNTKDEIYWKKHPIFVEYHNTIRFN